MKKKGRTLKKNGNVVYFPHIKERLMEKGLDSLQQKKYKESAELLKEALQLGYDQPELYMALILALYESGQYDQARLYCKNLLQEGKGDYYEVIELYIMILIQLNEHEEVVLMLNALFEEQNVPLHKEDHFKQLLSISQKIVSGEQLKTAQEEQVQEEKGKLPLFSGSFQEQLVRIGELAERNIVPFRNELISYLSEEKAHPILQTMVLNVLREHQVNEEVQVVKLGESKKVNPANLTDVFDSSFYKQLLFFAEEMVEQQNPTLFELMKDVIDRHSFLMYPFPVLLPLEEVAFAYYVYASELIGENGNIGEHTNVSEEVLSTHLRRIRELEEISSPNI
ncbi:tetratricopeptide repeat protein [Bacillus spongiae]|uniref:Tetratricopeptide repeat protein n=1 Tax=Bacillus spongiae TaxID=2683610 RepID=A0ABU8H8N4_9BACI